MYIFDDFRTRQPSILLLLPLVELQSALLAGAIMRKASAHLPCDGSEARKHWPWYTHALGAFDRYESGSVAPGDRYGRVVFPPYGDI